MNNKPLLKHVLISLFFLSIVSCSKPGNNGNSNNNNVNAGNGKKTVNTDKGKNSKNKVTVLCRCKSGFTSWSGPDQASAENRVKKNCSSIGGSAQGCKVIN